MLNKREKCGKDVEVTGVTCSDCVVRQPKIGVAAIVINGDNRILVSERLSGKMQGMYGAPGGHLEWMERFEDAAVRELIEETGLQATADDCAVIGVDQGFAPEEDHCWVIVFVYVKNWAGRPSATEPGKHGPWEWYQPNRLPKNTLEPLKRIARKLPGVC